VAATDRELMSAADVSRTIARIAHQIIEKTALDGPDGPRVVLLGIPTRGVTLATRLARNIAEFSGTDVAHGALDITLYRDDVIGRGKRPLPRRTRIPFSVLGLRVILVDDVVFTGRTIRAAMDAVIDFGRPEGIQFAALIDRGHRELPIQVDYVGKNIPTARAELVAFQPGGAGGYEVVLR